MYRDTKEQGQDIFCAWKSPQLNLSGPNARAMGELWNAQTQAQREFWNNLAGGQMKKMNAFMLFANSIRDDLVRAELAQSGQHLPVSELGRREGYLWRSLSPEQRGFWEQRARDMRGM